MQRCCLLSLVPGKSKVPECGIFFLVFFFLFLSLIFRNLISFKWRLFSVGCLQSCPRDPRRRLVNVGCWRTGTWVQWQQDSHIIYINWDQRSYSQFALTWDQSIHACLRRDIFYKVQGGSNGKLNTFLAHLKSHFVVLYSSCGKVQLRHCPV